MIDVDQVLVELWANAPVPKYAWYRGKEYMIGKRVYLKEGETVFTFHPGDYGKAADGAWWIRPPHGSMGQLTDHEVVEHEDGAITVSPSILLPDQWHGFLERGVWREA